MRFTAPAFILPLSAALFVACAAPSTIDGFDTDVSLAEPIQPGSTEALAVLAVVNDPTVTFTVLDSEVGLDRRAAATWAAAASNESPHKRISTNEPPNR